MKEELLNKEVLAMYDVRGIQEYIFRTNKVKEIIGASIIVENIIEDSLNEIIKSKKEISEKANLEWNKSEYEFDSNKEIEVEVGFIGGGNAYVLYRRGELCQEVNRELAKKILEKTYSLNLAVAVVEKTDNYSNDYKKVQEEMQRIKAKMPMVRTIGSFPITISDNQTGFPIVDRVIDKKNNEQEFVCTESKLKRNKVLDIRKDEKDSEHKKDIDTIFDDMITGKGISSMLAIVHIDGNNMGRRIGELMSKTHNYNEAIDRMRKISKNINESFKETYKSMEKELAEQIDQDKTFIKDKSKKYIRKIITAGDDITFVCNAKIALSLVEYFLNDISKKVMYGDNNNKSDLKKYGFSACAGIAYMYSHFPFSDAYKVAEECCASAKSRAKLKENVEDGFIGNWIDFQICKHISTGNLDKNRKKNYEIKNGYSLIRRPYNIACENCSREEYSFEEFKEYINYFKNDDEMVRSWSKKIRNTYPLGKDEIEKVLEEAKSRGKYLPDKKPAFKDKVALFYDALEIMDLFEDINMQGGI